MFIGVLFSSKQNDLINIYIIASALFVAEPLDSKTGAAAGVDDERTRNFIHRGHFGLLGDHPCRR